ncbi:MULTISPECIES: hypothetical protein [Streptomycetaceae]|uniref:hypothetical protein n=1 Tax=Streptomycetaceae TaxID=2062 RepID=UPI0018E92059|nr:hypothetical protein [Streptomyces sp. CB02056]
MQQKDDWVVATTGTAASAGLKASHHPFQRAGAWAVAVLAGRAAPHLVTTADLDTVADVIVTDAVAAATAREDTDLGRYDWWKALFSLYPNSPATHGRRPQDAAVLRPRIEQLFAPDPPRSKSRPCTFCGADTAVAWGKSGLPLFGTERTLNVTPPGVRGWPVCRACRIAMWALPYGAWASAGDATVLDCERETAMAAFARHNVDRARRIMDGGFRSLRPGARPELVALFAIRDATHDSGEGSPLCGATLWRFRNDNQEPWLKVTRARRGMPVFLATVEANARLREGWRALCRHLAGERGEKPAANEEEADRPLFDAEGGDDAARLLFEVEYGLNRPLLLALHDALSADGWTLGEREALVDLAHAYTREVFGLETDLEPVAALLTQWITQAQRPRERLKQLREAIPSGYRLGQVLVACTTHSLLGRTGLRLAGPDQWAPLIGNLPRAAEHRLLLHARVSLLLQRHDSAPGRS